MSLRWKTLEPDEENVRRLKQAISETRAGKERAIGYLEVIKYQLLTGEFDSTKPFVARCFEEAV